MTEIMAEYQDSSKQKRARGILATAVLVLGLGFIAVLAIPVMILTSLISLAASAADQIIGWIDP